MIVAVMLMQLCVFVSGLHAKNYFPLSHFPSLNPAHNGLLAHLFAYITARAYILRVDLCLCVIPTQVYVHASPLEPVG